MAGSPHVAPFSPYGYGMGIPMPGWPNYHMTQQNSIYETVNSSSSRGVVELTAEMTMKLLSKKSVEEVCSIVRAIDGISKGKYS
jgi:hypothetical protein